MSEDAREHLLQKKSALVDRWFDIALETYPADSSGFLRNKKRQFANPVGHTIFEGMEHILDELLKEEELDIDRISPDLDSIIRIRAVQDMTPSQALVFIFRLKKMLREELERAGLARSKDIEVLESRIDVTALIAFDLYVKCREKIYDLKANELRNMTFRLLQRANLVCEIPEE